MPPGEASPRLRKVLTTGFEGRHGQGISLFQDQGNAGHSASTPRLRKPGVRSFTDAKNPFSRVASKQISRPEDVRRDKERAGAPTRNPGTLPIDHQLGAERAKGDDGRYPLVPHRYGNQEWRPGKKAVSEDASLAAGDRVRPSWTRPSSGTLENYLNDMKRTKHSRGAMGLATPGGPPQPLQRTGEFHGQPPAGRATQRARSLSCEPNPQEGGASARSLTRARSVSQSPLRRDGEAGNSEKYGFTVKRSVGGPWTRGKCDLLLHPDAGQEASTPRTPSGTRASRAGERFDEVTSHMRAHSADQRRDLRHLKARDRCTAGLLDSEQVVLHQPSERRPKLGVASPRSCR